MCELLNSLVRSKYFNLHVRENITACGVQLLLRARVCQVAPPAGQTGLLSYSTVQHATDFTDMHNAYILIFNVASFKLI